MAAGPVQPETRAKVIALHGENIGRNEIARALGIGAGSVSRICAAEGLSFDTTASAAAVAVRQMNRALIRADIIDRLYLRTTAILDRLEAEEYTYRLVGSEGTYKVHDDDPPAIEERNLATSMGIYLDKAVRLEAVDANPGEVGAVAMLAALGQALGVN